MTSSPWNDPILFSSHLSCGSDVHTLIMHWVKYSFCLFWVYVCGNLFCVLLVSCLPLSHLIGSSLADTKGRANFDWLIASYCSSNVSPSLPKGHMTHRKCFGEGNLLFSKHKNHRIEPIGQYTGQTFNYSYNPGEGGAEQMFTGGWHSTLYELHCLTSASVKQRQAGRLSNWEEEEGRAKRLSSYFAVADEINWRQYSWKVREEILTPLSDIL